MTTERELYNEQELRALLSRDEGQYLEFKSLWDRDSEPPKALKRPKVREFIADYVAAFANADGGTLVLGAEDDGTPSGHQYPNEALSDFLAVPARRLQPEVRVSYQRTSVEGQELLVIHTDPTPEAVMVIGNGFPYRAGDKVIREPQEVINERKQAYRRVGFDRMVRPEARLEDLDLELAGAVFRRTVFADRPLEELLLEFGLALPRPDSPALTNAALLLFGRSPLARWHARAGVRLFRVNGTERTHGKQRNVTQLSRMELPIAALIPEVQRSITGQIRRSERLHDLFFREMPEYPTFAWQEALVNAVGHRDYGEQGREIEIWFYDDRLEVLSPGDLVPPVTVEAIRARRPIHSSRNPLIVRVLVECGIMREEGEGIPRIFEEMEDSLLRPPEFAVDNSLFKVTLRNDPIFTGPSREWHHLVEGLVLSTRQRRILLANPGGFTNGDYQKLNRVDRDQAYREIQEMVARGVVSPPKGAGRGAKYVVSPDLRTARVWLEKRLPAIQAHLAAHRQLKNADYRDLFGVTRGAALRELQHLVDEGFLLAQGERRGAHYVAGPALGSAKEE